MSSGISSNILITTRLDSTMSEAYYLRVRGEVKGPASLSQIVGLLKKKRLGRHHEISNDGVSWVRVADMPELMEHWAPEPRPQSQTAKTASHEAASSSTSKPELGEEWYYASGKTRLGPVSGSQVQSLLQSRVISGETLVWCESFEDWVQAKTVPQFHGVSGGQIARSLPTQAAASSEHCTNCGTAVAKKAMVCLSCGVSPRAEKNFCYSCGVAVNSKQIICVQCGVSLGSSEAGSWSSMPAKHSKTTAGLLAILLGGIGAHKFYHGSWGWGILYLVSVLTMIPAVISFVEAIVLLSMDQEKYDSTYNLAPPSAFKW
jgi:TM2 domain-containing membrane protein YozV